MCVLLTCASASFRVFLAICGRFNIPYSFSTDAVTTSLPPTAGRLVISILPSSLSKISYSFPKMHGVQIYH